MVLMLFDLNKHNFPHSIIPEEDRQKILRFLRSFQEKWKKNHRN